MRPFLVAIVGLCVTAAHAAMPPAVYQKARADAPLHVQVAIADVAIPELTPSSCLVTGEVVRVFRDTPGVLSVGDTIDFAVSCSRAGDRVPIGGTLWTNADALSAARFIEVYLIDSGSSFEVARDQSRIIEAPSDAPQFPED